MIGSGAVTAIPIEVRRAVVQLRHEELRSYEEIAELLGLGRATVNRILRRHRDADTVEPRPRGGGRRSIIHGRVAKLLVSLVTKMPDATIAELTEALERRSAVGLSTSSVQRALSRLGYSKKRPRSEPPSRTPPSTASVGARTAR